MDQVADRIVAAGLLTWREFDLGPTLDRAWPVEETPQFTQLLKAIDEADRQLCGRGLVIRADQTER